jgi:hypothetical protein
MEIEEIEKLNDPLDIKKMKLILTLESLNIERSKYKWTFMAIIFSTTLTLITIFSGIYLQNVRGKFDFELKATEIVLNSTNHSQGTIKSKVLLRLYPDRLPKDFVKKMEDMYGDSQKKD